MKSRKDIVNDPKEVSFDVKQKFFNEVIMSFVTNLIAVAFMFFSTALFAITNVDISGKYRCKGPEFNTGLNFDEPTVVSKTGETYRFEWSNKDILFIGTGILQGKTVSVLFWDSKHIFSPGIVVYQIQENGDLKGKWTINNLKKIGDEYCEKLK